MGQWVLISAEGIKREKREETEKSARNVSRKEKLKKEKEAEAKQKADEKH